MKVRRYWTAAEVAYLREHYPHRVTWVIALELGRTEDQCWRKANSLGIKKTAEFLASDWANGMPHLSEASRRCRFRPGNRPHNKGKKGWQPAGRSAETQFKPGHKPVNTWRPVGTRRITKDGILQEKISDTGYTPRDWKSVHSLVWQHHHGRQVPRGHVVVFRDGDRGNLDPANLELVTRAELMRRNSIHNLPPELVDTYRVLARLHKAIKKREGSER